MAQLGQEQSLKKQFTVWFRKNEKLFWVCLLVFVCFSFGMTGVMEMVIGDPGRDAVFACDGRYYTDYDWRQINSWLNDIAAISPRLSFRQLVVGSQRADDNQGRDLVTDVLPTFLAAAAEANRLGIRVSPTRIYAVVKDLYRNHAAVEKLRKDPTYRSMSEEQQEVRFREILDATPWSLDGYHAWIRERGYAVPDFEYALGMLLKVDSLRDFHLSAGVTSTRDLYSAYVRENRTVTLQIARLDAEGVLGSLSRTATDEELRDHYAKNKENFFRPHRVRFSYLKAPLSHFESQVTPSEEDLLKEYRQVRVRKYLKDPLEQPPALDYPLTPEEAAQADAAYYKPFEEVKDEIRAEIVKREGRAQSRALATQLARLMNPPPPPPMPAGAADPPEPPAPKTPQEIAAERPFLQFGETESFGKDDAEKVLGELYAAGQVNLWLKNIAEDKPLTAPQTFLSSPDGTALFLVCTVIGEKERQLPFEECKDEVAKAVNLAAAFEAAAKKAGDALLRLREGAALAEALPEAHIEVCGPYAFADCANTQLLANPYQYLQYNMTREQVLQFAVKYGTIAPGGETLERDVEREIVKQLFIELPPEDRFLPLPLEDKAKSRWYVVRIQDQTLPDAGGFTEEKRTELRERFDVERRIGRLLGDWPSYLREMFREHITLTARARA
ncbi:MAG TPA: hypothetical protein DCM87_11430 [Planctomycetes bacterium]|nr:hypothetical protein [Planctomycetota bacterium]